MTEPFDIKDGVPNLWDSDSIRPSTDTVLSPTGPAPVLKFKYNASGIYVYVKVESNTAAAIGCPTGLWKPPAPMNGFLNTAAGTAFNTSNNGQWTFTAGSGGDFLQNTVVPAHKKSLGLPNSFCRAWGWSPDQKFFAYAFGPTTGNAKAWRVAVFALDDAMRADGTRIVPTTNDYLGFSLYIPTVTFSAAFSEKNFGWVGSSGFFGTGLDTAGNDFRVVLSLRTAAMTPVEDSGAVGSGWLHVASPCGGQLACLPKVPLGGTPIGAKWISTVEPPGVVFAHILGASVTVKTDGMNPSVTTDAHTAKGVTFNPGSGGPTKIDDPDDTEKLGGLTVKVDRIQASTWLLNQYVQPVGLSVAPELTAVGQTAWVQIPPPANWSNNSDDHWCIVAQAYDPAHGVPRLWPDTGPVFPTDKDRCAQRNVTIEN